MQLASQLATRWRIVLKAKKKRKKEREREREKEEERKKEPGRKIERDEKGDCLLQ